MNALVQYMLMVISAAIVAGIILRLSGQGTMGTIVKLLCGLFMALTMISPILELELPDVEGWFANYGAQGHAAADAGAEMAQDSVHAIIKDRVRAYILDKAALYDASLDVQVTLDDAGVPSGVTVRGMISPGAKAALIKIIETDLNIGKEDQRWIS